MKRLPLLGLLATLATPLCAQTFQDQMDILRKSGESLSAAANTGSLSSMASDYRDFSNNLSQVESYVQNGNFDEAIRNVRRWIGRTKNEQVKKSLEDLLKGLQEEQKKGLARQTEMLDSLIKNARTAVTENKPVDAIIAVREEIEEFRDLEIYNGGRSSRRLQFRVDNAINFLNAWQRFVISESNGAFSDAINQLRNLRDGSYGAPLVDEAVIKARAEALITKLATPTSKDDASAMSKAMATIMAQVKTPADAAAAADATRRLASVGWDNTSNISNLNNSLNQLVRINSDFQDGLYGRVITASLNDYGTSYSDQLSALANQLRIQAAIKANDLPDLGQPKEGEGFGTFLRRAARESFEKKDWPSLFALLSLYANTTGGCSRTAGMQDGVRDFIGATQLEQSSLWGDAVRLYTQCLTQVGPLVPREEASKALQRLRTEHPEAFNPTGTATTRD